MTSATFGYHQLPNGYWIKDSDNSGPYVQSAPGVFGLAGQGLTATQLAATQSLVSGGYNEVGWLPFGQASTTTAAAVAPGNSMIVIVRAPCRDFASVAVVDMCSATTQASTRKYAVAVWPDATVYDASQPSGGTVFQVAASGSQTGFLPVTFSGSSSVTPSGVGASSAAPQFTASDFTAIKSVAATDGGNPFIIIALNIQGVALNIPSVSLTTDGTTSTVSTVAANLFPGGSLVIRYLGGVDVVGTPSSFASTGALTKLPQFGLVFRTTSGGRTILVPGDSIVRGTGGSDAVAFYGGADAFANGVAGWVGKLQRSVESSNTGIVSLGISGDNSTSYLARLKSAYVAFGGSDVIYPASTPNPETASKHLNKYRKNAANLVNMLQWARANKVRSYITTPTPFDSEGTEAGSRVAIADFVATVNGMAARGERIIDFNTLLAGANAYTFSATYSSPDSTHPPQAGHNAMLALALTRIAL